MFGEVMELKYKNKKIKLIKCNTFFTRLKGFMFEKNIDHALLFERCNSIHTFFMKENIDVIMCDKNNTILYYYKAFPKRKIILPKKKITKVIETPSNYFNIEIGTKIDY